MTITLQVLDQLDPAYVGKHNANYANIQSAINALQSQVAGAIGSLITGGGDAEAMFGAQSTLVNEGSYLPSVAGTDLNVAAGYFWHFPTATVRRKLAATTLPFVGESANTYYIVVDAAGEPTKTTSATGACYSVVWTGSAFGAITRLVPIAWGYNTFDAAKTLTNLGSLVYQTLDGLLEGIAGAATSSIAKTVTSANVTLTTLEAMENVVVVLSGTKTASRSLIVPNFQKPYVIINNTSGAFALTVKTVAGTGVDLDNGENSVVFCDATNVLEVITGGAGATQPYDVGSFLEAAPTASQIMLRHVFARQVIFASGLAPSQGVAGTAATAQADLDIQKNGSSVGTIRFAAAGTVASFIMASQTTFAVGDKLTVVAPGTADATLAKVSFTLAGTR